MVEIDLELIYCISVLEGLICVDKLGIEGQLLEARKGNM